MLVTFVVGQQIIVLRRILSVVAIPNKVQEPLARFEGTIFARNGVPGFILVILMTKSWPSAQKHMTVLVVEVVAAGTQNRLRLVRHITL